MATMDIQTPHDTEKGSTSTSSGSELEIQVAQTVPPPAHHFPEGSLRGWATLFGAFLVQYCTFGYTNAFGVYQDYYVRVYMTNYTPSDIGWIGGTQIFLIFSLGFFTGRAFDRGYFHYLMITGAVLHGVALYTLSLSHENKYYQVFLSQGLCLGLSCGLCYIPSLSIVSHYFHKRRPFAMGVVAAGSATGAVLHPIMLNKLFHGPIGFHNGVRVSASLNVFLLIVANLIMRPRLPPNRGKGKALPLAAFARDTPYLLAVIAGVLVFCGLFFPVFYLQLDAVTHGVDRNLAFYSLSILNAASIFGRTLPGLLAPKLGVFNLLTFATFGLGVIILTMAFVKDAIGTGLFAVFFGFFSGASIGLTPPMLGLLSKDMSELGVRLGIDFGFCGIMGLFATPIAGALMTSQYHWVHAILFAGITVLVSSVFFGASRMLVSKRKGTQFI